MELYDRLRKWAGASGELGLGQRAALGMTAGGFAQLVASPTDLVKVRLQMEGKKSAAGLAAATMGTPADVVKARVMNQGVDRLYKGSFDCLVKTVSKEGFASLYAGFLPCWLRMAPWSLTFWLTFEKLRLAAGLPPW